MVNIENKDIIKIAKMLYDYWSRNDFKDKCIIKEWQHKCKLDFFLFNMGNDLYLLTYYYNGELDVDRLFNITDIKVNDETVIKIVGEIMGDSNDYHFGIEYGMLIKDMISELEGRSWGIYMRRED